MPESFFILSKEHLDVAIDEVTALAKAYDRFSKIKSFSNIVMVRSKTNWWKIAERAAFVQTSGQVLRKMSGLFLGEANFEVLKNGKAFACRVINLSSNQFDVPELENSMGDIISKFSQAKVSLDDPDITIYMVFTNQENFFGFSKKMNVNVPKKSRKHPHELDRKLTRAMINLAGLKEGDTVCDPFCGTGTTLLEAESMGIKAIGIDYDKKMFDLSNENVKRNGFESEVKNLDFKHFAKIHDRYDGIVTDMPYGRASKSSEDPEMLVRRFVAMIPKNKKAAIMCKRGFEREAKINPVKRYDIYRHKNLTRTILIK